VSLPALYEISSEYRESLAALNDLDLDAQTIADTLESISGDLTMKCTNVGFVIRNMEALSAQIKDAEAAMAARRKALEARADHVREYLLRNMLACDMQKIESPYFTLSVRTNPPKVVIDDPEAVPVEYWRQPPVPAPEIDKKAIAAKIKAGGSVAGSHMDSGKSLSIK
jgi:hypothetical protein